VGDDLVPSLRHRPFMRSLDPRTTGFVETLVHPRMLASYALYAGILLVLTRVLDVLTPFWTIAAFIVGGASLPWDILDSIRGMVESTEVSADETEEDAAAIEEHDIRTSPAVGVPDDLSTLEDPSPDAVLDLSDLEDFDVLQEPDAPSDGD